VDKPGGIALGHVFSAFDEGFPHIRFLNQEYSIGEIGLRIHSPNTPSFEETSESIRDLLKSHSLSENGYSKIPLEG